MKNIDLDRREIAAFCERWKIEELSIFGSALGDDFGPESDVDVLVDFMSGARWTLLDLSSMREELKKILGREVDLITRRGLDQSENYLRRKSILANAQVIYAAG